LNYAAIYNYFAKDNLLSNLFFDECGTPFEKYSDYVLFNEIFKSGNWGVTIGIRAGRSVWPSRESSDVVLELEYYIVLF